MTIYRYGSLAWLWRAFIAVALLAGLAALLGIGPDAPLVALSIATPLLAPALFLGFTVAVRIDVDDAGVDVGTLIGWPRHLTRSRLGQATIHQMAQGYVGSIHAPRAWVPVRGSLPVYVDLLADIPDRTALYSVLNLRN